MSTVHVINAYFSSLSGQSAICSYAFAVPLFLAAAYTLGILGIDRLDVFMHPEYKTSVWELKPFMVVRSFFEPRRIWVLEPAPLPPVPARWSKGQARNSSTTTKLISTSAKQPRCNTGDPSGRSQDGAQDDHEKDIYDIPPAMLTKTYLTPHPTPRMKRARSLGAASGSRSSTSLLKTSVQNRINALDLATHGEVDNMPKAGDRAGVPTPVSIDQALADKVDPESPSEGYVKRRVEALSEKANLMGSGGESGS